MERYNVDSFEEKLQKVLLANPKAKEESVRRLLNYQHNCLKWNLKYISPRHGFSLKQIEDILNGND